MSSNFDYGYTRIKVDKMLSEANLCQFSSVFHFMMIIAEVIIFSFTIVIFYNRILLYFYLFYSSETKFSLSGV